MVREHHPSKIGNQPRRVVRLVAAVAAAWALASPALAIDPPVPLDSGLSAADVQKRPYADYVRECVDLLMQYGTDHYGSVNTPVLMSIIDVRDRVSPRDPLALDEANRVIRRGRRNPAGCNLWMDQPTLGVMYALANKTGNAGYAQFADNYLDYYLTNITTSRGFIGWGSEQYYDAYQDARVPVYTELYHEIAVEKARWSMLAAVKPAAVANEIQAIWQYHVVNKATGETNRHDTGDGNPGRDFAMCAGDCLSAFAYEYQRTGNRQWLDRAKLLANYYWQKRNTATNLVANSPRTGTGRFDGSTFDTSVAGLYAGSLLDAYEATDDPLFRDQAVAYLKAYARYGYDAAAGKFWGTLNLDGTPVPGPRLVASPDNYTMYQANGYVDVWQPYLLGYEFPLDTALTYAQAARLTDDGELLQAARRWADYIAQSLPAGPCEETAWYTDYAQTWAPLGAYAEQYGKAISFFVDMAELTHDEKYVVLARSIAADAVSKLYYEGIFRGHPGKPYYESTDGVGYLLEALVELDGASVPEPGAISLLAAGLAVLFCVGRKKLSGIVPISENHNALGQS